MNNLNNYKPRKLHIVFRPFLLALFIYSFFAILGGLLSFREVVNAVGASICLAIILFFYKKTTFLIWNNQVSKYAFMYLFYLVYISFMNWNESMLIYIIKYIYFVIFIILIYNNKSITRDLSFRDRILGIITVYLPLFVSVIFTITGKYELFDGRLVGIFQNPNNMALMAITINFFSIKENSKINNIFTLLITVSFIYMTKTTGAFFAFFVSFVLFYEMNLLNKIAIVLIGALIFGDRLVGQIWIAVAFVKAYGVSSLGSIYSWGDFMLQRGQLSGIWRLDHWAKIIKDIGSSGWVDVLWGKGIGATVIDYGILPHSDYLRVMYEQGILGVLFLILIIFYISKKFKGPKYLLFFVLFYMITENVIDNLFFMSLWLIFLKMNSLKTEKDKVLKKEMVSIMKPCELGSS